jgi:large subunit ribosomal protein L5
MNKIRKGDQVIVLAGRDKGKRGTVKERVDADHLLIEGVNLVKKHTKPNPMKGTTGGIVDKAMPIHQARPIASASSLWPTASACACSSRAANSSRLKRFHMAKQQAAQPAEKKTAPPPSAKAPKEARGPVPKARLQTVYREKIVPELVQKFGYKSVMQVPRLSKITLNMGVSEAVSDKKVMDNAVGDLTKIAGQKPVVTKSKKPIAGFKIRENVPIGCMVTLRGVQMYEFLDRFVTIALPRVRDFRGISGRAFDGRGNYNIGVKEQIIFPEVDYDKVDALRGLNISITTTAKNDDECKALLAAFKFPFKN